MNQAQILDLQGRAPVMKVNESHLSSGSPEIDPSFRKNRSKQALDGDSRSAELHSVLRQDLISLLEKNEVLRSYALIYRDVEILCLSKYSEQSSLAKAVYQELDTWLLKEVSPKAQHILGNITSEHSIEIGRTLLDSLKIWRDKLDLLMQLFLFLDQAYLKGHPKKARIVEYGLEGIMKLLNPEVSNTQLSMGQSGLPSHSSVYHLISVLLTKVRTETVSLSDEKVAVELVSTLHDIDSSNPLELETAISTGFQRDYRAFSKKWMKNKNTYVTSFLDQLGNDAAFLSAAGLQKSFIKNLISRVKWEYFLLDMERYVRPSFFELMESENKRYLKTLSQFCENSMDEYGVDASKALLKFWRDYIQFKVSEVISSEDMIAELVRLWYEMKDVCSTTFADENYAFEMRSTISNCLVPKDVSIQLVVQLSKSCDSFMKHGARSEEYCKFEKDVIVVFKLIANKADFTSIYEKSLSKRMLLSKHFDLTTEKKLVDKFISIIGETDENSNLRAMFRDYETSHSALQHFAVSDFPEAEFNALVLEKKYWPDFPSLGSELKIPTQFKATLERFEMHYKVLNSKNKYHILDWRNFALHQIIMQVQFDSGLKQLHINLIQASVLMLFEELQSLSLHSIHEATELEPKLLSKVIASLSTKRYPILVVDNEIVTFNSSFNDKLHKIRLPLAKDKDVLKMDDANKLTIKSRSSEIRSAIVRIMKDKRTLAHPALLGMVIETLSPRGSPAIVDIKAQLENLISNEFVRRNEDGTTLEYIP